jgi:hypothetical protein
MATKRKRRKRKKGLLEKQRNCICRYTIKSELAGVLLPIIASITDLQ